MDAATIPQIFWTCRTIIPSSLECQNYPLRILHILIEPGGCFDDYKPPATYNTILPHDLLPLSSEVHSPGHTYLREQIAETLETSKSLIFVLPYQSGHIIRSDFLQIRLQLLLRDCQIHSFCQPLAYCGAYRKETETPLVGLCDLLNTAVGGFSIAPTIGLNQEQLEQHICDRLSYLWLSSTPVPRRRVALLRGRPNIRVGGPVYSAAKALGVSLVIIDEEGHWLQADTPHNKALREAFLTIDMGEDADLPSRIAAAVNEYPEKIDGIFTLSDNYLVAVAKAAGLLGLTRSPAAAYEVAFDKALTRQLHAAPGEHTSVRHEGKLQTQMQNGSFKPQYPLIVKPRTRGWNSQFVRKVRDEAELLQSVREICPRYNDGVVIEPYYDGPEIDVNIVMARGEVLFQEIVDEPPSCGDLNHCSSADFLENGMRAPSILPQQEQSIIFDSVAGYLTDMGFANGVFHVEARISRSSMELREESGSIDLVPTSSTPSEDVKVHLIEINARPPGLRAQILTQLTYGVDYFAVQILSAINDRERLESVCQPYTVPDFPSGAQCWSQVVHLPVLMKGMTLGAAGLEALLEQVPELAAFVVEYQSCFEAGEMLPDPAEHADFFGHIVVSSTRGRKHVVEVADELFRAYRVDAGKSTMAPAVVEHEKTVSDDVEADLLDKSLMAWRIDSVLSTMFVK